MNDELTAGIISQRKPVDRAELLARWRPLLPELDESVQPRRFLGRELTLQEAGWVCESFRLVAGSAVHSPYEWIRTSGPRRRVTD